ncbi:MAG TPA: hypothetical protein VGA61_20495, partial [Anaerolineae bacterium]
MQAIDRTPVSGINFERVLWLLIQAVLLAGAVIMVMPFIWMLSTAVKLPPEILRYPPQFIPQQPTLANFAEVFRTAPFPRYFLNSLLVATISTISVLVTSML